MRICIATCVALALVAGGCFEARVHTRLDVRDLLPENVREGDYTLASEAEAERRIDPLHVSVPEQVRNGDVESVGLEIEMAFAQATGTGSFSVAVFVAGDTASVYAGGPFVVLESELQPGPERLVRRTLEADPGLLALVRADVLHVGCHLRWQAYGEAMAGDYRVEALNVLITTTVASLLGSAEPQQPLAANRGKLAPSSR